MKKDLSLFFLIKLGLCAVVKQACMSTKCLVRVRFPDLSDNWKKYLTKKPPDQVWWFGVFFFLVVISFAFDLINSFYWPIVLHIHRNRFILTILLNSSDLKMCISFRNSKIVTQSLNSVIHFFFSGKGQQRWSRSIFILKSCIYLSMLVLFLNRGSKF